MLEAAGMQGSGKYWQMQDMLFKNQSAWSKNPNYRQLFLQYAENIGLDTKQFQDDFAGGNARSRVEADRSRGRGLGVSSTPSIFVNSQLVPVQDLSEDGLRRIIDGHFEQIAKGEQAAQEAAAANAAKPEANTESK
jgi:protein-disulfide isomerase